MCDSLTPAIWLTMLSISGADFVLLEDANDRL
jgi:hypothetical protein